MYVAMLDKEGRVLYVKCEAREIDDKCAELGGVYLCHDETMEGCRKKRDKDPTGNAKWQ